MIDPIKGIRVQRMFVCDPLTILTWLGIFSMVIPSIGSLSLRPTTEEILSQDLCPDPVYVKNEKVPQSLSSSNEIMTISLRPRKETNKHNYFRFEPCTFVEDFGSKVRGKFQDNATIVKIRSINLHTHPWDFSGATECQKFIMFRSWAEYGNGHPNICGRDNFQQYVGPNRPIILYYHLREEGFVFPLLHPENIHHDDRKDDRGKGAVELKYLYISLSLNGGLTCRLQQYSLDYEDGCPRSYKNYTICGQYNCSELDSLYQKRIGVARNSGDFQQQYYVIVKSKSQERYRLRNFIRQKVVPVIFVLVLLLTLRRYHHRNHLRPYINETGGADIYFHDIYLDHLPGLHIPYDPANEGVPTVNTPSERIQHIRGKLDEQRDSPPSYNSLFPPTYSEAIATTPKSPKA